MVFMNIFYDCDLYIPAIRSFLISYLYLKITFISTATSNMACSKSDPSSRRNKN